MAADPSIIPTPGIFAIDQATLSGWSFISLAKGERIASGIFNMRSAKANAGESRGMRFLNFKCWLAKRFKEYDIKLVCHEQTIAMGMGGGHNTSWATSDIAAGLKALIETECAQKNVPCTSVCPSTLKKWATGSGRAGKPEMIRAAIQRCNGYKPKDDNEADAILIGMWAWSQYAVGLNSEGN